MDSGEHVVDADVAIAVLAAGGSRRLGRPKQLVTVGGEPLVRHVTRACVTAGIGTVAVVVGAHADVIGEAIAELRVAAIVNGAWESGIASSIVAAVRWAETTEAKALVIILGDQPLLTAEHVVALRDAWRAGAAIAASRYAGALGAPAIFDRSRWAELARLEGDQGAGKLVRGDGVVAIAWEGGAIDVDTPEDVDALSR